MVQIFVLLSKTFSLMFRVVFWVILPCKMIVDRRFRWWWWRQYAPLKRQSIIILHGSITQKTTLNIILAAVRTWNLKTFSLFTCFQTDALHVRQLLCQWYHACSLNSDSQALLNTASLKQESVLNTVHEDMLIYKNNMLKMWQNSSAFSFYGTTAQIGPWPPHLKLRDRNLYMK
jgi:hypothetical protein